MDMLPDDILLAIFDFCADESPSTKKELEAWQSLVHVCQRWRSLVFISPRRLNLRLVCTAKTPVRDTLDVWPPLPLVIQSSLTDGMDSIVAVLERKDRVDSIELFEVNGSSMEKLLAAMQDPFPELTFLRLESDDGTLPVLPDSFLGGSAPRLRFLWLNRIPFLGLPKLILSTTHLVNLLLLNIPHSGYISPEAMVSALSSLIGLKTLALEFLSPRSHPGRASRRSPPQTRTVLPFLTYFSFEGVCEYLDAFVAFIDAPRVNLMYISFFNDIVFDIPQFIQFVCRTPTLKSIENARVVFGDGGSMVNFQSQTPGCGSLKMEVSCRELDWQVSSLEQVCTSCLPPFSKLEDLYIYEAQDWLPDWQDSVENLNMPWLELLRPFTTVRRLHLSKEFAPRIVSALQELIEDRTTEILPILENISLEELQPMEPSGPVQEGIGKFVGTRQLSGHPITISIWKRDPEQDWVY
jgi:F-box-like